MFGFSDFGYQKNTVLPI